MQGAVPYFKLLKSICEKTRDPEAKGEDYPKYWRVCVECERRLRLEDWALWTQEEKDDDPAYCEPKRIDKDLKLVYKGKLWNAQKEALSKAREDIALEAMDGGEELATCSKKRKAVLNRASKLAAVCLEAIQSGGITEAFAASGNVWK